MGLLDRAGARLTAKPEDAEILVVNTCSFIDTAKQESATPSSKWLASRLPDRPKNSLLPDAWWSAIATRLRRTFLKWMRFRYGRAGIDSGSRGHRANAVVAQSPFNILSGNGHAEIRSGRESGAGTIRLCPNRPASGRRATIGKSRDGSARDCREPDICCRRISTTKTRRAFCQLDAPAYIKIAEGCDHPAASAFIPTCVENFARGASSPVVAEAQRLVASGVREITLMGRIRLATAKIWALKMDWQPAGHASRHRRPALAALPSTPIRIALRAVARKRSRSTTTSASISTCRCNTLLRRSEAMKRGRGLRFS